MTLDRETLTDPQWLLAHEASYYPVILKDRSMSVTARSLEKQGWGAIEPGGDGERIFRMNQAGCTAFARTGLA